MRDELAAKLQVAFRIIADYGKALERHAEGGLLMPESQLPAERDAIKACILLAAAYRISNGAPRDEIAVRARISYATLAHFVPDDLARREARFHEAAQAALGDLARKEAPSAESASSLAGAPVEALERVRAGYEALGAEFDAALARLLAEGGIA